MKNKRKSCEENCGGPNSHAMWFSLFKCLTTSLYYLLLYTDFILLYT